MVCWNALLQVEKGAYADEVDESRRGARMLELEAGTADLWEPWYQVIMGAQNVLDYVDVVDMSGERRDFYKGQAYFFKALAYFDLVRRWGDCILQKGGISWEPVAKTPWPLVCDFAIEMAEQAAGLLPPTISSLIVTAMRFSRNPLLVRGGLCFAGASVCLESWWQIFCCCCRPELR